MINSPTTPRVDYTNLKSFAEFIEEEEEILLEDDNYIYGKQENK